MYAALLIDDSSCACLCMPTAACGAVAVRSQRGEC